MIRAEFHCHTYYSKDSLVTIPELWSSAKKKGIDRVVVTDHNTFKGAIEAYALDPQRFVMGEEIMTLQGELIGIYMQEEIPARLPVNKTIDLLHQQGALISVAHPFDSMRSGGWELKDLQEITPYIDAIEVFNSRCMTGKFNDQARNYATQHNLLGTAGSDSHSLVELGNGNLILPEFNDASSLKLALASAELKAHLAPLWVHFYSRYAVWRKKTKKITP